MEPELRSRIVRWAAWAVLSVLLVLTVPVAVLAVAPVGCSSCHAEQAAVSEGASPLHADASCASCHVGPTVLERVRFGYYQTFGMLLPVVSTQDSPVSLVGDGACIECHDDLGGVSTSSGLRIRHESCAEGSACAGCHSLVAHPDAVSWPSTYSMEACLECHSARQASNACESCHVGKLDRRFPTTGTFPITHGPNWQQTHGMGEMSTCAACHAGDFCESCHGPGVPHSARFVSVHALSANSRDARCLDCHARSFCDICHVYPMPHPEDFAPEHSRVVAADGDTQCGMCHAPEDCTNCHVLHVHPGGAVPTPPVPGGAQ